MTIDTKKEIEGKVRKILVRVYAHAYDDAQQKLRIEDVDEAHRKDADIYVNEIMVICTSEAEKREKEVQNNVCDQILEELREYRKKYPDANYHDCVGTILGMKIRPFGVLPIKEEYVS